MVEPIDDDDWWRRGPDRDDLEDDFEDEEDEPDNDGDEEPVVECPQCGEDVYDDANQCPACGWWFVRDPGAATSRLKWWLLLIGFVGAGLAILGWIMRR